MIEPPAGAQHLSDLFAYLPTIHASLPLLPRAYEISSQMRIGVYDCLYVALAEQEGCALLTADDRLARTIGQVHSFVVLLDSQ